MKAGGNSRKNYDMNDQIRNGGYGRASILDEANSISRH